jgi:sugar phosphate isomerase/epimerase
VAVHPRVCVSGISSWRWSLDQDLAFYAEAGIDTIGVALRKLDAEEDADGAVERLLASGLRIANLIGVGPFLLDRPQSWAEQQHRAIAAVDTASRLAAECLVLTTGPAGPLTWEDAASAFAEASAPVRERARRLGVAIAIEHTNSLRVDVSFVHTLRDVIDLARALDVGVCMEVNACWAERDLATTIASGIDRIQLVQVSDFRVGTLTTPNRLVPGDGDIPLARILGQVLDAGYGGVFDLELIGPAIEDEGYEAAITRSVEALAGLLT